MKFLSVTLLVMMIYFIFIKYYILSTILFIFNLIHIRIYKENNLTTIQQSLLNSDINLMNNINCILQFKYNLSKEEIRETFNKLLKFKEFKSKIKISKFFNIPSYKIIKNFNIHI